MLMDIAFYRTWLAEWIMCLFTFLIVTMVALANTIAIVSRFGEKSTSFAKTLTLDDHSGITSHMI